MGNAWMRLKPRCAVAMLFRTKKRYRSSLPESEEKKKSKRKKRKEKARGLTLPRIPTAQAGYDGRIMSVRAIGYTLCPPHVDAIPARPSSDDDDCPAVVRKKEERATTRLRRKSAGKPTPPIATTAVEVVDLTTTPEKAPRVPVPASPPGRSPHRTKINTHARRLLPADNRAWEHGKMEIRRERYERREKVAGTLDEERSEDTAEDEKYGEETPGSSTENSITNMCSVQGTEDGDETTEGDVDSDEDYVGEEAEG